MIVVSFPLLMKICIKILWLVICLIRINDMYVCKLVPCKLVLYCIRFNTVFTVHGDDARIKVWTTIKDTLCISRDSLYYGSKGCYSENSRYVRPLLNSRRLQRLQASTRQRIQARS